MGIVVRKPGKGSFVHKSVRSQVPFSSMYSFSGWVSKLGHKVTTKILKKEIISDVPSEIKEKLHLGEKDKVFYLERLRFMDDKPVSIQANYINYSLTKDIMDINLVSKPLGVIFYENFSIETGYAKDIVSVSTAKEDIAKILNVKKGCPLLELKGVTYTVDDIPYKYTKAIYNGNIFEFNVYSDKDNMADLGIK